MIHIAPDAGTPDGAAELLPSADAAVDTLYHRYGEAAVRSTALRTGDRALAEDAVHEGFIQVLQRLRRGDEDLLARQPARVVQRNARWAASRLMAHDRSVGDKARMLGDASLRGAEDPWEQLEMRLELEQILAVLPPRQRRLLALRYVERLPDAVSAELAGLSVKAFRCRVDRALLAARQAARGRAA